MTRFKALAASLAVSLFSFSLLTPMSAGAANGQGLEISPPLIELSANPGDTVTADIRVRNVTSISVVTTGTADDFGAADEKGDPKLLLDEKEQGPYSLKYWIKNVPDLQLVPQEVKTAKVAITVPANAEPGGHYGVVRFTGAAANPSDDTSSLSISASIGALILLKVNGPTTEKVSVETFQTLRGDRAHQWFQYGPIGFAERLKDEGNVHEHPNGTITVKNMFGGTTAKVPVNSNPARNVLPGSIRAFNQSLHKHWMLGRYTADLNLKYADNKTLTAKTSFWVIPYKAILAGLIVLVVVIFGAPRIIRRYNRWVVKKAQK